jgi:S-formylglutathione hydrolase
MIVIPYSIVGTKEASAGVLLPPKCGAAFKLQRHASLIGEMGDKHPQQSKYDDKYILFTALIPLLSLYLESPASINSATMAVTTKATIASFGGKLLKLSHNASTVGCEMAFNLYLPPQSTTNAIYKVPLLIYLSGLTCTPDNCSEKGFFQHGASKRGIAVLYPDTSPSKYKQTRLWMPDTKSNHTYTGGLKIEGEDDSYDFGSGAGFYVDATASPWSSNYKMYSYVTDELPNTVFSAFPQIDSSRVSITGHSMGGHGAMTLFLKNPGKYKSCSAFAPIANPLKAPWGEKAFKGYFGEKDWQPKGKEHDATELVKGWKQPLDLLIDVVSMVGLVSEHPLTSTRVPGTTFTTRDSSFRRISQKLPKRLASIQVSTSGSKRIMTTAIIPWRVSPTTMLTMRPSIFLHSMFPGGHLSLCDPMRLNLSEASLGSTKALIL